MLDIGRYSFMKANMEKKGQPFNHERVSSSNVCFSFFLLFFNFNLKKCMNHKEDDFRIVLNI